MKPQNTEHRTTEGNHQPPTRGTSCEVTTPRIIIHPNHSGAGEMENFQLTYRTLLLDYNKKCRAKREEILDNKNWIKLVGN